MKLLVNIILGFLRFWYDFLIGDCWQLALGAAVVLAGGVALVRARAIPPGGIPILVAAGLMVLVVLSAMLEWRHRSAKR